MSRTRVWRWILRQFSTDRPRRGWRRAAKEARRQGRQVNDTRLRRLWRDEGLRVPRQRRTKRQSGVGVHVGAMCPIRPKVAWALDFRFDSLLEARVIIEDWRIDYNWKRPHTAHGDLTPSEFAAKWTTNNEPQAA